MVQAQKTELLTSWQVEQKVKRMAYEIYEQNIDEKGVVLAGIYDRGYLLAQQLQQQLEQVSPLKTNLVKITLDKQALLQSEITLDKKEKEIANKVVILVDDVLNTGRTVAYSLKPFLNMEIKKLQTAFMVDRNHATFPIAADYVGYSLSTTLQEHVEVVIGAEGESGVYLH